MKASTASPANTRRSSSFWKSLARRVQSRRLARPGLPLHKTRVTLLRTDPLAAVRRQEELPEEGLELDREPALDTVPAANLRGQLLIESSRQLPADREGRFRLGGPRADEDRIRVAVEHLVAAPFHTL